MEYYGILLNITTYKRITFKIVSEFCRSGIYITRNIYNVIDNLGKTVLTIWSVVYIKLRVSQVGTILNGVVLVNYSESGIYLLAGNRVWGVRQHVRQILGAVREVIADMRCV